VLSNELLRQEIEARPFELRSVAAEDGSTWTTLRRPLKTGASPCDPSTTTTRTAFEIMSKRRRGFPSESRVKRGQRVVHGDKELHEKLGRNDLCPCESGRRFQELLPVQRPLSTDRSVTATRASE
jgi:hypothetical protein